MLYLEDGRVLWRSNMGYCGMLDLIAIEISSTQLKLRRWLADMADRTPPFCEIDLRGLSNEHRQEFWLAAMRALVVLERRHGPQSTWSNRMYAGGEPGTAVWSIDGCWKSSKKSVTLNFQFALPRRPKRSSPPASECIHFSPHQFEPFTVFDAVHFEFGGNAA